MEPSIHVEPSLIIVVEAMHTNDLAVPALQDHKEELTADEDPLAHWPRVLLGTNLFGEAHPCVNICGDLELALRIRLDPEAWVLPTFRREVRLRSVHVPDEPLGVLGEAEVVDRGRRSFPKAVPPSSSDQTLRSCSGANRSTMSMSRANSELQSNSFHAPPKLAMPVIAIAMFMCGMTHDFEWNKKGSPA